MIIKQVSFFLLFCIQNIGYQLVAQNWVLEKEKKGIQVFTRKVANYPVKEYKAVLLLKTTVGELTQLMKNHEELKTWFVKCTESTRLKKISEEEYYIYLCNDAPWPAMDRDNIVHIKFELKDDGTQWIHLTGVPNYIPEKSGKVRIKKMKATWEFQPLPDGKVKITQQVLADLGGNIPAWLVNLAIVDAPFNTMCNLKKKLLGKGRRARGGGL